MLNFSSFFSKVQRVTISQPYVSKSSNGMDTFERFIEVRDLRLADHGRYMCKTWLADKKQGTAEMFLEVHGRKETFPYCLYFLL